MVGPHRKGDSDRDSKRIDAHASDDAPNTTLATDDPALVESAVTVTTAAEVSHDALSIQWLEEWLGGDAPLDDVLDIVSEQAMLVAESMPVESGC